MCELCRVTLLVVLKFRTEHIWKPRIVLIIGLNNDSIRRRTVSAKQSIDRIRRFIRVPAKPNLRPRLADCWAQKIKTALAQRLRLLNPRYIVTFERLDRVGGVVLKSVEYDPPTMRCFDYGLLNLEQMTNAHCLDLYL